MQMFAFPIKELKQGGKMNNTIDMKITNIKDASVYSRPNGMHQRNYNKYQHLRLSPSMFWIIGNKLQK